jgi:threonyl-tRNA synthetase
VVICTITEAQNEYAEQVKKTLEDAGIRVFCDLRNEKISYKIREHMVNKVPVIFTVGAKEVENKQVNIRRLGSEAQETLDLGTAVSKLVEEVISRK